MPITTPANAEAPLRYSACCGDVHGLRPASTVLKKAPTALRIGEVARRADVNVQTLRYYERRGLLPAPRRRPSGYREYPPDTVRVVRFIKRAQELGFSLRDIEELIKLRESRHCASVRAAVVRKAEDVAARIRRLTAIQKALEEFADACESAGGKRCPIIEALNDET